MIGARVRHARLYHGWTQEQLAQLIGVSQPAINQIEATGNISDDNLRAIAKVTDFAEWWFRLGPLPDLPDGSMRYRKRASATKRDEERIRSYARQTIEAVERLSAPVELPPVRLRPLAEEGALSQHEIEGWAATARHWLGVGRADPIPNLTKAIERAGIFVLPFAHELEKHDGVSFWPDFPGGVPFIFYTRGHSGDRQRFSIAHELGHLCLHQSRHDLPPRDAEDEANAFASALLAPREGVYEDLSDGITLQTLAYTKATWGLSIRALIRRSLDLGVIDFERRQSLEKQYANRGWTREEPVSVPEETPTLLRKLVEASHGPLTTSRVKDVLGVPSMATRELVA